jgi:hypothetical protein
LLRLRPVAGGHCAGLAAQKPMMREPLSANMRETPTPWKFSVEGRVRNA